MQKRPDNDLTREDFVNAMKEMDTFMDVAVDDLLELNSKAAKYARHRKTESLRIDHLMTRDVLTVAPDTSLAEAAHLLVTHRISGLPVVDAEQRLLGVITEADFLRAMGVPSHHPTHSLWQTLESMFAHHTEIHEPTGTVAEQSSQQTGRLIESGPEAAIGEQIGQIAQLPARQARHCPHAGDAGEPG